MTGIPPQTAMETRLSELRQFMEELAQRQDVPSDVARRGAELGQAMAATWREQPCAPSKSPLEGGV